MTVTTYKWSIEEWHELVETGTLTGKPIELLDGEIIEVNLEEPIHSSQIVKASEYLRAILGNRAQIREAHPITLDNSEPEPDIAIVRCRDNFYEDHHPYPQDIHWLIEVSNSTLSIDTKVKSKIYARNGIGEYWIMDLVNKQLIVHTQPVNDTYTQVQHYTSGSITSLAFPKVPIDISKLLPL